jgi:asparagine synthetase A
MRKENKMDYFSRSFDIEGMLEDNGIWLSLQIKLPKEDFVDMAEKLSMEQKDWDKFWKKTRYQKNKLQKRDETIACIIRGKEHELTREEFGFVYFILLGGATDEVSNCCGAGVYPHNDKDHTSRCRDCGEGCRVVYVWDF